MPGRTLVNSKLPSEDVVRTADTPFSVLVNVTFASETTPPDESLTVPTTEAVSNCAKARGIPAPSTKSTASRLTRDTNLRMYSLPEG